MEIRLTSGVGGVGSGGHWPRRLVTKCQNFGQFHIIWAKLHQNFSQFHITWAILHQNFGQFHIFLASLRQNFGQFNIHQTVSISEETFFFGGHLNWDRKTDRFSAKIDSVSFFGQKFGAPQILLSSYAHAFDPG